MSEVKFSITKTRAYVWRVNAQFSDSHFNWITCWNVVDEHGTVVVGGHNGGSNNFSGYAKVERKRDAQAYINGYTDAQQGKPLNRNNDADWYRAGFDDYVEMAQRQARFAVQLKEQA